MSRSGVRVPDSALWQKQAGMSNSHFSFKQFTIKQERCAMKVGTDGCLLGAWTDISNCRNVLDVGCGSGLIAIMMAQRCNARITGLEIDSEAAMQAAENVAQTPWKERIEIVNCNALSFAPQEQYDVIVSNPPFFSNSIRNKETKRAMARHDDTLPCAQFMDFAKRTLTDNGHLSVVIPSDQTEAWCNEAIFKGLSARRISYVRTLPHKPIKRALIEFVKGAYPVPCTDKIIIENRPGEYSDDIKKLLGDFYMNL